jgi:hypothetical protein
MQSKLFILPVLLLIAYSLFLFCLEWSTSQAAVRPYFDEIKGPVRFFAINTSLSVFLLLGTSLLFFATLTLTPSVEALREKAFLFSQVCVFAYLGFDDRFRIHERIGVKLGIDDHYVLLLLAALNGLSLLLLGRQYLFRLRTLIPLIFGCAAFGVMTVIDGFVPVDAKVRLSVEDLLKVWGGFGFLVFSWSVLSLRFEQAQKSHQPSFSEERA